MKRGKVGVALLACAAVLSLGGLTLFFIPAEVTPGLACNIADEVFCFRNSTGVMSPYRVMGIVVVAGTAAVAGYLLLRRD